MEDDVERITMFYGELADVVQAQSMRVSESDHTLYARFGSLNGQYQSVSLSVSMDFLNSNPPIITRQVRLSTYGYKSEDMPDYNSSQIPPLSKLVRFFGVPENIQFAERVPPHEFGDYFVEIEVPGK